MFNTKRAQLNAEELEQVAGGVRVKATVDEQEVEIPRGGRLEIRVRVRVK